MTGDNQAGIARRHLLAGAGAIGLGATSTASAQPGFDWKRFKGEKLEISLILSPRAEILRRNHREFEELTGITVGGEQTPEQQHRQRTVIEFVSGRPSFDVVLMSWHVQKRQFGKAGWLADLRPMLADPTLTAPDFDFADFSAGGREYATDPDGKINGLPIALDYIMLYYNREMFDAKGVAYPTSLAGMYDAAQALHDPANRRFGWVARGLRNANVYVWASMMLGWGEDPVVNGELNTTGPAAVESATLFTRLNRDFGPPGIVGFNWNESQSVFAQGNAAMWMDSSGFSAALQDPARSKVVGKVGFGVIPPGPKTRAVGLTGDGIGIAEASRKKGAAFLYCQWATSKINHARFVQSGSGAGARDSIYADPKVQEGLTPASRDWVKCILDSAPHGRPCLPTIVPVTQFRDTFGIALTNAHGGADVATEMRKATEAFAPVLKQSE